MEINHNIYFFVQCLVDSMYPDVAHAVNNLFKRLGLTVYCPPEQTCCGQMIYNSGYREYSRSAAKHFIKTFEEADIIVCPSGSCVKMVREHYPVLLKDDIKWSARANAVSMKIFELTEFLVDKLEIEKIDCTYEGRVTYHDSCSVLRGLGIREQPRKLLKNVEGVEFVEMKDSDRCCGFGGAFSYKYSGISSALAEEKVNNIVSTGADTVVTCDIGCLMNIEGMISRKKYGVKCLHIAQLLST